MFSIGDLSRRASVKVPTIRFYEDKGLLAMPHRTSGNQRRYDAAGLERLRFIKHARDLGFSIEAIADLIDLQNQPDHSCQRANDIARDQLAVVRDKIAQLRALEAELRLLTSGCTGSRTTRECGVLAALSTAPTRDSPDAG